jgi:SAM-dependent methyltransferase
MIASFYEIDDYYTHTINSEASETSSSISFLERLRIHLAWRLDRGEEMTIDWFSKHFGSTSYSICEIGCGNGRLLEQLRVGGHTVCGVEPDPQARSLAIETLGLQVFPGTAESLPSEIQSRRYDLVIMSHVLEHTVDPVLALRNAMELLTPSGKLVVETPNNSAISLRWSGITWFPLRVPEHLNFFTKPSLHGICKKVGLKVLSTEFSGYCRQFMGGYIRGEQEIWEFFRSHGCSDKDLPSKNSNLKAWLLLLRTVFAEDEQKHDCVRVIAERQE